MHKYYDPRLFHAMSEEEMKAEYAPKAEDGVVLGAEDVEALDVREKVAKAVDVTTPELFIASGFDVNFVGPAEDLLPVVGAGDPQRAGTDGVGAGASGAGACGGEELSDEVDGCEGPGEVSGEVFVDAETFGVWLESPEFSVARRSVGGRLCLRARKALWTA